MIIVGTDFSKPAARALTEARLLSSQIGLLVQVVHVCTDPVDGIWSPTQAELDWLDLVDMHKGEVLIRSGTIWVDLVRVARERRARFIAVGTHGRSGSEPLALGSTASRLVLLSPIPVILVGKSAMLEAMPAHRDQDGIPRAEHL